MKISVVTVCYNAADTIERTMLSVLNQTYHDIEYIIIDGGSTDGTVDIIRKYADKIAYWASEPDKGIYDAMNKGIKVATGEWINFMNAGDYFMNEDVLGEVTKQTIGNEDGLYGDTLKSFSFGKFIEKAFPLSEIEKHMAFGHQAAFIRTALHKKNPYDINLRSSADYNLFYVLYKQKSIFRYIPILIVAYEAEFGMSANNYILVQKENAIIHGVSNRLSWKIMFLYRVLIYKTKAILRKMIPLSLVNWLRCRSVMRQGLVKEN